MPAHSPLVQVSLAPVSLAQDEDLFDFAQVVPARAQMSVRETRLLAVPVAHEPAPALWPRLLPWVGAQAAATAMLAACVAQAMPQMAPKPQPVALDFALRLGAETAASPLPAGLDDGFRLRLSRPNAD